MADHDMIDRLRDERQTAVRELSDAETQAQAASEAAAAAISNDAKLRDRLGSIADPAPFIQQELKKSGKVAAAAAEEQQRATEKVQEAQQALADLDKAIAQLKAGGFIT